ncbi:MAG: glycosyltransferase [Candidatus Hodarchaeales archaeon]|jgi:trehalose synthase
MSGENNNEDNKIPTLREYKKIVGSEVLNEIFAISEALNGKKVVHLNSTRVGGGVAEILHKLIPLLREAKIDAEWRVIQGNTEFYKITKDFHNALHGSNLPITHEMVNQYLEINQKNAESYPELNDADFVVVHDPQPAALINYFPDRKGKWIWRCHIDVSSPSSMVWNFFKNIISQYNAVVFHEDSFTKKDLMIRQFIVPPSIDPLSSKNKDISEEEVQKHLEDNNIHTNKLILTQIGRFDRLKDPNGVIKMFQALKTNTNMASESLQLNNNLSITTYKTENFDCQLILAGGLAADDPEGIEVYQDVVNNSKDLKDVHILQKPYFDDLEINAMQRASYLVLQKSLREGFGLTVSEALWKGIPVIGGNTGGIPLQIIHGRNGFLVNSIEEATEAARFLLNDPKRAVKMGKIGKEHIRKYFLITRHVRDHLLIYLTLQGNI